MKIKICGITTLEDAFMVLEAGAEMVGFNFYPKSPRYIPPAACALIMNRLIRDKYSFTGVGVFVNSPMDEIRAVLDETGLPMAQCAGDEPVERLALLGRQVFKSVRLPRRNGPAEEEGKISTMASIQAYADLRQGEAPTFLLDSLVEGSYGGTGTTTDWGRAAVLAHKIPFLLAGGLTPENVETAIRKVHPWGVDAASGVESSPGRKDQTKVGRFILNARAAEAKNQTDEHLWKHPFPEKKS